MATPETLDYYIRVLGIPLLYNNPKNSKTWVPKDGNSSYFPMGASVNCATTEGKLWLAACGGLIVWSFIGIYRDSR